MPQVTIADHEHKELLSIKERFLALMSGEKGEPKEEGPNPLQETVDQLQTAIQGWEAADADKLKAIDDLSAKVVELEKENAELQEKLTAPKDDAKE